MEIYSIYQFVLLFLTFLKSGSNLHGGDLDVNGIAYTNQTILISVIVAFAVFLVFFIFQAIGLYKMAKKRGIKHKWRAFFPFINTYFIGKLAGECSVFGHKMKRAGLYAMLAQIGAFLVCGAMVAAEYVLFLPQFADNLNVTNDGYFWSGLSGFMVAVEAFYRSGGLLVSIISLAYQILTLILVMGLYKRYTPRSFRILGIVSAFQPLAKYICIFVLRNREAIDYEAYLRKKQEEFFRRQQEQFQRYQQQFGNNSYGGFYGNSYANPYNNPYQNGQNGQNGAPQNEQPKQPEEPFGEFSNGNSSGGGNNNGNQSGGDGLFD